MNVHDVFSSIANKYERLNTILTLNIDKSWRRKAITICELKEGYKVLDLCCGTGQMVEHACKIVGKNTEVIGLDFNEEMIAVGYKSRCESLKEYKYKLMKGDVLDLPFEDNSFDRVIISFGLRNVNDKKKALAEIYRVLKVGGKAICLELSKPQIYILKNIYNIYFNHIVPIVGYIGTADKKAYNYLRDSVNGFMTPMELESAFETAGFCETGFTSLTLGSACIHYGRKNIATGC